MNKMKESFEVSVSFYLLYKNGNYGFGQVISVITENSITPTYLLYAKDLKDIQENYLKDNPEIEKCVVLSVSPLALSPKE